MEHNKIEKRDDDRRMMRYKNENSNSAALTAWKIVGGTALVVAAAVFVVALPDIKRYIKISSM